MTEKDQSCGHVVLQISRGSSAHRVCDSFEERKLSLEPANGMGCVGPVYQTMTGIPVRDVQWDPERTVVL